MRKTEIRTIRGVEYQITQFGAREGQVVALRVAKYMGKALKEAGSLEDPLKLASGILGCLDESDFDFVTAALAKATMVKIDGKRTLLSEIYDAHFAGALGAMVEWLAWGVAFNFSDFFSELATLSPQRQAE